MISALTKHQLVLSRRQRLGLERRDGQQAALPSCERDIFAEAKDWRVIMEARAGSVAPRRGPLTGIRVIELADEQAEYCGLTLAGLGADVIKVEPPGGSPTRWIGPFYQDRVDPERSLFFWQYNRGKRSIVLDLARPDDRQRFHSLVAGADVLLESTPRGELDGLGLGADALMKEFPA